MDSTSASNALELSLSLKPPYVSKSLNHLFSDLANIDYIPQKLSVLNEYLEKHQEELSKVEEFKRELPQCVLLLMDAIQVLNDEISRLSGQLEADEDECKNRTFDHEQLERRSAFRKYKSTSPPFNPRLRRNQATTSDHDPVTLQQCELNSEANELEPQPAVWKHNRRSWTPELHTRFVEALSLLGGPEVATPKQIREVMKVEGLTNDQVKSHLQKYRLHSRGGPASGGANRDLWRPIAQLYYRDFWNPNTSQSNTQQQQQQYQGGRNGGVLRIGGGSSSRGGRGSRENAEIKKSKKSRFGDA